MARNTALRAAAEVLGKVATLLLTVIMAKQLGAGAVGDFTFAMTITMLYWPIAGFGLDRMMLREVARDETAADELIPLLNGFKLGVGILCTVIGTAIVASLGRGAAVNWCTLILGVLLVVTLLGATAQTIFLAHEKTQYFFIAALPIKVFGSILGIVVLLGGAGIIAVSATNLVAALIGLAIGWWILDHRFKRPEKALNFNPKEWLPLMHRSGPWGLQELFGQIVFRLGIVVLFLFTNSTVVGEYAVAYRLLEATLFLPWSIATSVLPLFARARPEHPRPAFVPAHNAPEPRPDDPSLERVVSGSIELVMAVMLPIAVLLGLCAGPIIELLFPGPQFSEAATYLPILAVSTVVYGVGHMAGLAALSHLPGRKTVMVTGVTAIVGACALLILVPPYEGTGAAVASVITETTLASLTLWLTVSVLGPVVLRGLAGVGVPAAIVMFAVVYPVQDHLWYSIIVGSLAYAAVIFAVEFRRRGPLFELVIGMVPQRVRARA